MSKTVEVSVTSWRKNVVATGSEHGRVLLMPGTGYTCDRPLLYWAGQALAQEGWRIDCMSVHNVPDDLSIALPVLCDAVDRWVTGVRGTSRLLLIGKSLTTMTYPHVAVVHRLPFVLLTPVLHHADFDPSRCVIPVPAVGDARLVEDDAAHGAAYPGPAPMICAGTADPFYDHARASALTPHVHEYPGANHSIEVPGHWHRSLDYLKEVTVAVSQYAAAIC